MKILFAIFAFTMVIPQVQAQLRATPVCPAFVVDVLDGSINKIDSKSTSGTIKQAFPLFY